MSETAPTLNSTGQGRIQSGRVIQETLHVLLQHRWRLPVFLWPAFVVSLVVPFTHKMTPNIEWTALLGLTTFPFDLMLSAAWTKFILLGPKSAKLPPLKWGKGETDFTIWAVVFAVSFPFCVFLIFRVVGNIPIADNVRWIVIAFASWITLSLMTPIALQMPIKTVRGESIGRAWQSKPSNVPHAALCWLSFITLAAAVSVMSSYTLNLTQDSFIYLHLVVDVIFNVISKYILLISLITLITVMARQLAGWPKPDMQEAA